MPKIGRGRRVAVLAVHHVEADGYVYTGGAEKFLLGAVDGLLASGADVVVGFSGNNIYHELVASRSDRRLVVEATNWIDEVMAGDRGIKFATIRDRMRWFRKHKVDTVFVVQQARGAAFCSAVVAARLLGLRVVSTLRQSPTPLPQAFDAILGVFPRPGLWRKQHVWRHRLPAVLSHRLIYNNETVANDYERIYKFATQKRTVVYNSEPPAVIPRSFHPSLRLGYVGRITKAKGVDTLLEAFAKITNEFPAVSLTLFGDGPLREELIATVSSLGLQSHINLPGHISDRKAIYDLIDLYIHPSLRESFPNSIVEAFARGIPCIATIVGGIGEAVINGKTGMLVKPESADSLSDAIRLLISDPVLFDTCARNALEFARTKFDPAHNLSATIEAILQ